MRTLLLLLLCIPAFGFAATDPAEKDAGVCLGYIAVLASLAHNNPNSAMDYSVADEEWSAYMIANKEDLDKDQIQAYALSYFEAFSSIRKIINSVDTKDPPPSVQRYVEQGVNACSSIGVTSFKIRR